jgi:hypothetical protein
MRKYACESLARLKTGHYTSKNQGSGGAAGFDSSEPPASVSLD